jgi:hypothetical protein
MTRTVYYCLVSVHLRAILRLAVLPLALTVGGLFAHCLSACGGEPVRDTSAGIDAAADESNVSVDAFAPDGGGATDAIIGDTVTGDSGDSPTPNDGSCPVRDAAQACSVSAIAIPADEQVLPCCAPMKLLGTAAGITKAEIEAGTYSTACFPPTNMVLSFPATVGAAAVGAACTDNASCASYICQSGICAAQAAGCTGPGSCCTSYSDCCLGTCAGGECACTNLGAGCGRDQDCCSGHCSPHTFTCIAHDCIEPYNVGPRSISGSGYNFSNECLTDAECCGGLCEDGVCDDYPNGCAQLGAAYNGDQPCCSQLIIDGQCALPQPVGGPCDTAYCVAEPGGSACSSAAVRPPCAGSEICDQATLTCVSCLASTLTVAVPCAIDSDCCTGRCVDTDSTTPVAMGLSPGGLFCHPSCQFDGETCASDAECCRGTCGSAGDGSASVCECADGGCTIPGAGGPGATCFADSDCYSAINGPGACQTEGFNPNTDVNIVSFAGTCGGLPGGYPCPNDPRYCAEGYCSQGVCAATACVPSCGGRQCGANGCGGSCGNCPTGTVCSGEECQACTRNCSGRTCGSDGCGGICGTCPAGGSCSGAGVCTACTPSCSGLSCGADGCGGSCGLCADGEVCNVKGACVGGMGSGGGGGTSATCPDFTSCLTVVANVNTTSCEASGYSLTVTNACSYDVQYEFCFQLLDSTCDCGEDTIAARDTRNSPGDYACNATGLVDYYGTSPASWGQCPVLATCN